MISICVTCKNRSYVTYNDDVIIRLFPKCVTSIVNAARYVDEEMELVVSDWMSDDWAPDEWLPKIVNHSMPYKIVDVKSKKFSRGKGRNIAFSYAKGDKIFFLDTDMLIDSPSVFHQGKFVIEEFNGAFFPICRSFYDHQHIDDWERTTGFGNFMTSRENMRKVGKWQEKTSWGGEDDNMFLRLSRTVPVIRKDVEGFYHQWHPEDEKKPVKKGFWRRLFK